MSSRPSALLVRVGLFVLAAVAVVSAACTDRASCSDNGDCLNQNCKCDSRYEGPTCNDRKKDDLTDMKTMLQSGILLLLIYILSAIFRHLRAELLGGIVAGFLLGPVAGWTAHTEGVYTVGRIGLSLLVMEGGLGIDVERFKKTWKLTTNLALTGTILPCLLGWALLSLFGYGTLEGFAAGTALSSTSIGMSLMMLIQFDYLKTPLGGIIAVAAMIDDVASLVILAVLGELQEADAETDTNDWVWLIFKPVLISLAVIVAGAILTAIVPGVFKRVEAKVREHATSEMEKNGNADAASALSVEELEEKIESRLDYLIVVGMLLVTFFMVISAGYAGSSYLLGAFASGMAFSQLRKKDNPDESRAEALWGEHSSLSWWLVSVSFATLGFSIPAGDLFEAEGFGLGMLYVIPAILGKLCLGSFVPGKDGRLCTGGFYGNLDDALVVGWAMVARGELGFVMSQESFEADILSSRTYVACVWALFVCTLVPPFIFGWALARKKKKDDAAAGLLKTKNDVTSANNDLEPTAKNGTVANHSRPGGSTDPNRMSYTFADEVPLKRTSRI